MSGGYDRVISHAPNVVAAAPTAAPALAQGVASGAVSTGQLGQLDAYVLGGRYKTLLDTFDEAGQHSYWDSQMTPEQQAAAKSAGFAPAWEKPLLQDVGSAVGGALGWAWGAAKTVGGAVVPDMPRDVIESVGGAAIPDVARDFVGDVGGGVSEALSWGNNKWKAGYRQGTTYDIGVGPLNWVTQHWGTAAIVGIVDNALNDNKAENELGNFNQERLEFAKSQMPDAVFVKAFDAVSNGKTPSDLIAEASATRDQKTLDDTLMLIESGGFQQAMKLVSGAQISPGRDLATSFGMNQETPGFNFVSGIEDGVATVMWDPMLALGPVGKSVQAARFGIHTASGIAKMKEGMDTSRYWKGVSEHLTTLKNSTDETVKEAAYSKLRTQYAQMTPFLPSMVENKVSTIDELRDHISSGESFMEILKGKPGTQVPLMPYRSKIGEMSRNLLEKGNVLSAAEAKVYFKSFKTDVGAVTLSENPLEHAAIGEVMASRNSIAGRALTAFNRPFSKVPELNRIEFRSDTAHDEVYKLAREVMPRFWANKAAITFMESNDAGKRSLVMGLLQTVAEVSGINNTVAGRALWARHVGEELGTEGNYAAQLVHESVDAVTGEKIITHSSPDLMSDGTRGGIFTHQMNDFIEIPNFRDLYNASVRLSVLEQTERSSSVVRGARNVGRAFIHPAEAVGRIVTNHGLDVYTEDFWKPGVLLRPSLPFRNSGEEAVNNIARNSATDFYRGVEGNRNLMVREEERRARAIISALGPEDAAKVKAGEKNSLSVGWLKAKINSGRNKTHKHIFSEDDDTHLNQLVDDGEYRNAHIELENATDQRSMTNNQKMERANDPLHRTGSGGSVKAVKGPYREVPTGDVAGAVKWAMYNNTLANNPESLIALENISDRAVGVQKILEFIEGDAAGARYLRRQNALLNDVGAQEWSERVFDVTKQSFSQRDGTIVDQMVRDALDNGEVSANWIEENLASHLRPEFTSGRELQFHSPGDSGWTGIKNLIDKGFQKSEHWTANMSRHNTFAAAYLRHRSMMKAGENILAERAGAKSAAKLATRKAKEAAIRDVMEYSDNPAIRSQFAVIMRNVFPFWRAQEEFYVRWAKTGVFNPYAYRKMQLTAMGLENAGVLDRDQEGHLYFSYPIFGAAAGAVTRAGEMLGLKTYLPVPNNLTGQLRFLNQGLDSTNIQPSFGPAPSFLVQSMRVLWPQTAGFERALLGELAAGRNPVVNQLPTFARRIGEAYMNREANGVAALAYLEAGGHTPGPNASPQELQLFKERVQHNALTVGIVKSIFGAFAPAAPETVDKAPAASEAWQAEGIASVSDEFWQVVQASGDYEMAMAAWIKVHPDLMPFTVAKSKTPSGAIVPVSTESGAFISNNKDFFERYPSAAPYWLASSDGEFDPDTWQLMIASGIKERKTYEEYYKDLKSGPATEEYYNAKDAHEAFQLQAKASGDALGASAENDRFAYWKEGFLAQNPLVQEDLAYGGVRANERKQVVDEITRALADPSIPQTQMTQSAAQLIQAYNAHMAFRANNDGQDDASVALRNDELLRYNAYAQGLAGADVGANLLYNKLFRWME